MLREIQTWEGGETDGFAFDWEARLYQLNQSQHELARLCLILMMAPYRFDHDLAEIYRARCASDKQFAQTMMWASRTEARRISSWL